MLNLVLPRGEPEKLAASAYGPKGWALGLNAVASFPKLLGSMDSDFITHLKVHNILPCCYMFQSEF